MSINSSRMHATLDLAKPLGASHGSRNKYRHRQPFRANAMELARRRFLRLSGGAVALPALSIVANAQTYPSRAITIIVPYAAGGGTDLVARILADRMKVSLSQPVIVQNIAGGTGTIGVGRAARAAADGYTLSIGSLSTHVLIGALYALQYDLLKDFAPIALLASEPLLIVTKKTVPARDLKELIAWLRSNPDKASQGIAGVGNLEHVVGISFQKETSTRFQVVPYRGGAPAVQDLVAGQIDIIIGAASNTLQQVRAGNIKAYAVTAKSRLSTAPDIPTVDEAGLRGFYNSIWFGLWAPARVSPDIIAKLNGSVVDALADASVRKRLADIGQEIFPRDQQTPEALRALQKAEIEKWWPIIKAAGIKGE